MGQVTEHNCGCVTAATEFLTACPRAKALYVGYMRAYDNADPRIIQWHDEILEHISQ